MGRVKDPIEDIKTKVEKKADAEGDLKSYKNKPFNKITILPVNFFFKGIRL